MANKALIVIDTNVIVAGVRSQRGWAYQLLCGLGQEGFDFCISVPLLCEYEEILKRDADAMHLSLEDADTIIDFLCNYGRRTLIYFNVKFESRDPDDQKVVDLAVAASAGVIVTYNKRHFAGLDSFGIVAFTPREFLTQIGAVP